MFYESLKFQNLVRLFPSLTKKKGGEKKLEILLRSFNEKKKKKDHHPFLTPDPITSCLSLAF